ncbi:hypothetical protein AWZ03_013823 [Drosophila navojoa]|uniref:Uncharacterized protein n=1 Tax=Drosophila navojoa TaxID=7232 RepID=A0A484ATI5_DRONA|nr:hypothetical protein AWZ03_013823 [Drosophila navojoa]
MLKCITATPGLANHVADGRGLGGGQGDGVANLRISMDFSICAFSNIFESREQQQQEQGQEQEQEQEQKSTLECAQQLLPGLNMQSGSTGARSGWLGGRWAHLL